MDTIPLRSFKKCLPKQTSYNIEKTIFKYNKLSDSVLKS